MSNQPQRLFLIDGSSYIYRAYYAIRHLSNSQGMATNAIYGFTNMLLKVMRELQPDQLAVIFDSKGPTFRKEIYPEYKANRSAMPEDLVPQIPYINGWWMLSTCRGSSWLVTKQMILSPRSLKSSQPKGWR